MDETVLSGIMIIGRRRSNSLVASDVCLRRMMRWEHLMLSSALTTSR